MGSCFSIASSNTAAPPAEAHRHVADPPPTHPPQAERGRKRLNFLLKQAEVFQHFAPATVERERKKRGGRHGTGRTEEQEDEELLRDEEGGAEQAGHRLQVGGWVRWGRLAVYSV